MLATLILVHSSLKFTEWYVILDADNTLNYLLQILLKLHTLLINYGLKRTAKYIITLCHVTSHTRLH